MVIAGAIAKAGLGLMGKKARMSLSGSILGNKGQIPGGGKSAAKDLSKIAKHWGKYFVEFIALKKIIGTLAKASPALNQQLIIVNKSLLLFLRPIGDIMAKFVRPMSLWMIKFATRWYQLFGTGGADKKDPATIEDEIKNIASEIITAEATGDTPRADALKTDLAKKEAELAAPSAKAGSSLGAQFSENLNLIREAINDFFGFWLVSFEDLKVSADTLWKDVIPEAVVVLGESVKDMFNELGTALKSIWDILAPLLAPLWELTKVLGGAALFTVLIVLTGAFKVLEIVFLGISTTIKLLMVGFDWFVYGLESLALWFKNNDVWGGIKDGFKAMINWVIDKLNILLGVNIKSLAVGGEIEKTGMYQLHSGERVLTAGENSRNSTSNATNIINNINVSATINNDLDIRLLARRLAEYSEIELRRRGSYL